MPRAARLEGETFGLLFVEGVSPESSDRVGRWWRCRCRCGATVDVRTQYLTSGRSWACPACGGPEPARKLAATCIVCGRGFEGGRNAQICSRECRESRRRGVALGLDHAPPPIDTCVICGAEFHRDRGRKNCCSPACIREKRRRAALASWRKRHACDPSLPKKMYARKKEKMAADPEYRERVRRWDAHKYRRHRAMMKSDPEYAARHRQRCAEHWVRNRDRLLEERRARLDAMGPADLERWLARTRRYCREWRRRKIASMTPEQKVAFDDRQSEYRRQRQRLKLFLETQRIEELADGRRQPE